MITIPSFTHHVIPLFQPPGKQGAVGGKVHLSAVKTAFKDAARINGALKLAGRTEIALIRPDMDIFDLNPGMTQVRKLLVEQTTTTQQLRWVVLTVHSENIRQCIQEGFLGAGMKNLSVGLAVADLVGIEDKLEQLRGIRCRRRILLLHSSEAALLSPFALNGIDWLVWSTPAGNAQGIEAVREICRSEKVAFVRLDPDASHGIHACREALQPGESDLEEESACLEHPFEACIQLRRRTLGDLEIPSSFMLNIPSAQQRGVEEVFQLSTEMPVAVTEFTAVVERCSPPTDDVASREDGVAESISIASDGEAVPVSSDACVVEASAPVEASVAVAGGEVRLLTCTIDPGQANNTELAEFRRLGDIVVQGLKGGLEAGMALREIRDRKLWKVDNYPTWNAYCEEGIGITKQYANRLIKAAESFVLLRQVETIVSTSLDWLPQNEVQMKELYPLRSPEKQVRACLRAVERTQGPITAIVLRDAVAEIMAEEDAPPKVRKPGRKELLAQSFESLRAAVSSDASQEELLAMIKVTEGLAR